MGLSRPGAKFHPQRARRSCRGSSRRDNRRRRGLLSGQHQAAETSVAARTLVRPIEGASARANTPAHIELAQADTSPESEHPAPSLSIVDEARADESKVANRKIYNDTSTGSVPSKFQYFKPFSKEWKQRREEEARRLKAATTICRC